VKLQVCYISMRPRNLVNRLFALAGLVWALTSCEQEEGLREGSFGEFHRGLGFDSISNLGTARGTLAEKCFFPDKKAFIYLRITNQWGLDISLSKLWATSNEMRFVHELRLGHIYTLPEDYYRFMSNAAGGNGVNQ
jgi:hypothetical protein